MASDYAKELAKTAKKLEEAVNVDMGGTRRPIYKRRRRYLIAYYLRIVCGLEGDDVRVLERLMKPWHDLRNRTHVREISDSVSKMASRFKNDIESIVEPLDGSRKKRGYVRQK